MSTWRQKPSVRAQNTHLPRYPSRYHANPLSPDTRFVSIAAAVVLCVTASLPLGSAQAITALERHDLVIIHYPQVTTIC